MKKIAIYARVSTFEQEERNQLPAINALIKRRDFEPVRTYQEQASAWSAGHQKEFSRLLKDAAAGEFSGLVVWSLDRITREGPSKILQIIDRLERSGITVYSVQEPWTEAPSEVRPLLLAVIGWVAQLESKRRSERTKAGLLRKKLNGGLIGRRPGSKDKHKRRTDGYKLRQARERIRREENGE
jgi:putative DNA-invertase from lambdoid prophage Rac